MSGNSHVHELEEVILRCMLRLASRISDTESCAYCMPYSSRHIRQACGIKADDRRVTEEYE